jgi:hypothetical protein
MGSLLLKLCAPDANTSRRSWRSVGQDGPRDACAKVKKVNMRNSHSLLRKEKSVRSGNNAPKKCPFLIDRTGDVCGGVCQCSIFGNYPPPAQQLDGEPKSKDQAETSL